MALVQTVWFYQSPGYTVKAREGQISGVNVAASDTDAYNVGWLRLWEDTPAKPGSYYDLVEGTPTENAATSPPRLEKVNSWQEWTEEDKANAISAQIDSQILNATVQQRVVDPAIEADISRTAAAAEDKHIELQETVEAGGDLEAFDPTIDVTPPQNGKGYSQLAISIIELEPWAGAPDDNLGFEVMLDIQTDYEDQGAEARLYVIDAPKDTGAVLPFTQDADDPKKWAVHSREGYRWQDPSLSCTVQLLWGAGSLPTSRKLKCKEKYDRQSALVRYSVPTTKIKKKAK